MIGTMSPLTIAGAVLLCVGHSITVTLDIGLHNVTLGLTLSSAGMQSVSIVLAD